MPVAESMDSFLFLLMLLLDVVVVSLSLNPSIHLCTGIAILGYARQFRGLEQFLSQQSFADQIEVIGKPDRSVTGNFEVTVKETGQLLHSKRTAGQGKAESAQERAALVEMISELLDD